MTFVEFVENRVRVTKIIQKYPQHGFPIPKKSLETLVPKLREYVHRCRAKTGNPRALIVVSHRDILA